MLHIDGVHSGYLDFFVNCVENILLLLQRGRMFNQYLHFSVSVCARIKSVKQLRPHYYINLSRLSTTVPSTAMADVTNGNSGKVTIGTHNGSFHCDETLACSMLKLLDRFKDAEIVRTRDQSLLDKCDIVVDVGGVFDPKTHR